MKRNFLKGIWLFFLFLIINITISATTNKSPSSKNDNTVILYIVRHGKTMLNTTDRVQGWSDAVLTPAGIEVAEYLGEGLKAKKIKFVAAYSSDSGRSIQTADIILKKSKQQKLPLKTDWRLREFNFGSYEGEFNHVMWTEIAEKQGKTMKEWFDAGVSEKDFANSVAELDKSKTKEGVNWPAEDYETIVTRLKAGIDDIVKEVGKNGGGNVLVVSHGLSIVALVNYLDPEAKANIGLKNASVTKITYKNGKYTIDTVGDMSFVELGQELKNRYDK